MMKTILFINSSIRGNDSHSAQLAQQFLAGLPQQSYKLDTIDLDKDPVGHLDMDEMVAWMTPEEQRTDEQKSLAAVSDNIIARVKAADVILVGVPMYNFAIPSQLKAFFDRLARAGITFKYTENGSVGLLQDKPVIIFTARGGIYQDTPADSQTPFLISFFNFVGLKDLHFVYAEGLNMGAEAAKAALEAASARLVAVRESVIA